MPKRYVISENQINEIKAARNSNKCKRADRKLKVLLLHAQGCKRSEIAEKTEYKISYISDIISAYCNKGIGAIVANHYKGNNRNLTFEQEAALLEPFRAAAKEGKVISIADIKNAYDKAIGRSTDKDKGRIYRVLKRHGWRKVMPRSKHPNKADEATIDASKKLSQRSETQWKIMT
jgi:transposase